jgi:hypothetical protein
MSCLSRTSTCVEQVVIAAWQGSVIYMLYRSGSGLNRWKNKCIELGGMYRVGFGDFLLLSGCSFILARSDIYYVPSYYTNSRAEWAAGGRCSVQIAYGHMRSHIDSLRFASRAVSQCCFSKVVCSTSCPAMHGFVSVDS